MGEYTVPPTKARLLVKRDGHAVVREWRVPKPVVLVDTRERTPLRLFKNHPNWIGGERRVKLATGDYSVEGMEDILALERKSLPDVIKSTMEDRDAGVPWSVCSRARLKDVGAGVARKKPALLRKKPAFLRSRKPSAWERFLRSCERLAKFRWKAILVEATYEDMKSWYEDDDDLETDAHPNAVCGTLDAIEAKFGIPILYTSRDRDLASEKAASWLSKHFTYWWLEENGHDRVLIDTDGL